MGNITRAERLRRRHDDDGDPEDTVYYASDGRSSNMAYHDTASCRHLRCAGDVAECSRTDAQAKTRYPCAWCVTGDADPGGSSGGASPAQLMRREEITSVADLQQALADRKEDA